MSEVAFIYVGALGAIVFALAVAVDALVFVYMGRSPTLAALHFFMFREKKSPPDASEGASERGGAFWYLEQVGMKRRQDVRVEARKSPLLVFASTWWWWLLLFSIPFLK